MLMAVMMSPRETWTDERLDDLNKKVDEVKSEMREGFSRLEVQIRETEARSTGGYERMGERFHALNMTLLGGFFVMIATLIGAIVF